MDANRAIIALTLLLISSFSFCSCRVITSQNINRINLESSLYSVVKPEDYNYNNEKIRDAIVQQIPIGANWQQVQDFVNKNFNHVVCEISTSVPSDALYHPVQPCVYIRAIDIANSAGGEMVEIYLLTSDNKILADVIVKSKRSYL